MRTGHISLFSFAHSLTVPGEDFTFDGPLVFQFVAGPGNTACISINITDDVDFEGDRPFTVMLSENAGPQIGPLGKRTVSFSSPSGPLIGPNSQTVVTINDPEGKTTQLSMSILSFVRISVSFGLNNLLHC